MSATVNTVMSDEDKFCIALLCMADTIYQTLEQRTEPKTRRWNKLQKLNEAIQEIDATYHGSIDDDFREHAEQFYDDMEANLTKLIRILKNKEGEPDGQVREAEEGNTGCTGRCGEVLPQGQPGCRDQAETATPGN